MGLVFRGDSLQTHKEWGREWGFFFCWHLGFVDRKNTFPDLDPNPNPTLKTKTKKIEKYFSYRVAALFPYEKIRGDGEWDKGGEWYLHPHLALRGHF